MTIEKMQLPQVTVPLAALCYFQATSGNTTAGRSQALYGKTGAGQFHEPAVRGHGYMFPAQSLQAQVSPLLPDYGGLQYPGY